MIREPRTVLRLAILQGLRVQFLLLCVAAILSVASARAQVWIGPSVGLDTPVFHGERHGDKLPGVGLDLNIRIVKQYDLMLGLYLGGVVEGNDADPIWLPVLGIRSRRLLGNKQGMFSPFVAGGLGLVFAQAELGFEIALRSFLGLEAGIRDRFSVFNSLQAFLLFRIGRQHIK